MKKPRLFICGDSWTDYEYPKIHQRWTYYLTNHYEVHLLGKSDMDNISIMYQIGEVPNYEEGDRIIVFFTSPSRIFRKYFITETHTKKNWLQLKRYTEWENTLPDYFYDIKVIQHLLWENNMRNDEINFYRKLNELLKNYQPIFVTWSDSFYRKTNDFTHFIDVSLIKDETNMNDNHPGILGNYEIYEMMMKLLDNKENLVEFGNSSII